MQEGSATHQGKAEHQARVVPRSCRRQSSEKALPGVELPAVPAVVPVMVVLVRVAMAAQPIDTASGSPVELR